MLSAAKKNMVFNGMLSFTFAFLHLSSFLVTKANCQDFDENKANSTSFMLKNNPKNKMKRNLLTVGVIGASVVGFLFLFLINYHVYRKWKREFQQSRDVRNNEVPNHISVARPQDTADLPSYKDIHKYATIKYDFPCPSYYDVIKAKNSQGSKEDVCKFQQEETNYEGRPPSYEIVQIEEKS